MVWRDSRRWRGNISADASSRDGARGIAEPIAEPIAGLERGRDRIAVAMASSSPAPPPGGVAEPGCRCGCANLGPSSANDTTTRSVVELATLFPGDALDMAERYTSAEHERTGAVCGIHCADIADRTPCERIACVIANAYFDGLRV